MPATGKKILENHAGFEVRLHEKPFDLTFFKSEGNYSLHDAAAACRGRTATIRTGIQKGSTDAGVVDR
jgi:hypothetical protein